MPPSAACDETTVGRAGDGRVRLAEAELRHLLQRAHRRDRAREARRAEGLLRRFGQEGAVLFLLLEERLDLRIGHDLGGAGGLVVIDEVATHPGDQRRAALAQEDRHGVTPEPRAPA